MMSFSEKIDQVQIPDKYKRNKSKILPLLQILKHGVESMDTKAGEFIIDKETCLLRSLSTPCKNIRLALKGGGYSGITDTNISYTITPRFLVKNLQSMYRDLSVFWFLDTENSSEILPFLAEHKFFTVVYSIEFHEPIKELVLETPTDEPVVEPLTEEPVVETPVVETPVVETPVVESLVQEPVVEPVCEPVKEPILESICESVQEPVCEIVQEPPTEELTQEPVVEPLVRPLQKPSGFSYASVVRNHITVEPDTLSHHINHETRAIPANYRGGKYNKTEFENVREYYQKWGNERMFVMFCSHSEYFSREDRLCIRNLMNNDVLSDPKYKKIIRDKEYYFVKVVKTFHYDTSRLANSLHFNIIFKNEYIASQVYHIYVDSDRTWVTRISTLTVDNK
jgi:hypothetical protein